MLYSKATYRNCDTRRYTFELRLLSGKPGRLRIHRERSGNEISVTAPVVPADQHAIMAPATYSCPADPYPGPYSGDRIQITYCNPYTTNASNYTMMIEASIYPPMGIVAATKPVTLSRIGFTDNSVSLPVVNGVPTPQTGQSP